MPLSESADQPASQPHWSRVVPTSGIHNFRDYGDYRVAGGGRLARGMLYRSGEPAHPSDRDLELVRDLGLAAVIDLRGRSERELAPARFPSGFAAPVIRTEGETAVRAPHVDAAAGALDATAARRNLSERYATLPFRGLLVDVYRRYFLTLASSSGPTLVYCTAGKDRTGLLVALLHSALGVHRDDMFADYLLTNSTGDVEARVAALTRDLQSRFGNLSEEAVRVVTSVEPLFLQSALDAISARHGSVERYLADVLGVTPYVREMLSARLLR